MSDLPRGIRGWALALVVSLLFPAVGWAQQVEGDSSRSSRNEAVRSVPLQRLPRGLSGKVKDVIEHPSFYRRMPTQQIECDPQMFEFLVRRPEVMVNIWQLMGITQVTAERLNALSFFADDGVGTTCRCELILASQGTHIYFGTGDYDGSMAPRPVTGNCVCILRSTSGKSQDGRSVVRGTMDVFLKLDNFGADLLARSVAPFVGKTADYNFVETAKFISQISQICERSPHGAQGLASRLDGVDPSVRREFSTIAASISMAKGLTLQSLEAARPQNKVNVNVDRGGTSTAERYSFSDGDKPSMAMRPRVEQHQLPQASETDRGWRPAQPPQARMSPKTMPTVSPQKTHIFMRR